MKNVVILMQSRTASSLVAGTFRAHGWSADADSMISRGYHTHENQLLRNHLVGQYGMAMPNPLLQPSGPDRKLRALVLGQYGKRPWFWKGDAYYFEAFKATFEDLAIVYVKRYIPDAIRSSLDGRAYPHMGKTRAQCEATLADFLRTKYTYMNTLQTENGGRVVYTTDVLKGIFTTLQKAVNYAGGDWDEDLVHKVMRDR